MSNNFENVIVMYRYSKTVSFYFHDIFTLWNIFHDSVGPTFIFTLDNISYFSVGTSVDVIFWRLKSVPALKELKKIYKTGIQMNRKELTKTFMMISNWKKPFGLHGLYKAISAL